MFLAHSVGIWRTGTVELGQYGQASRSPRRYTRSYCLAPAANRVLCRTRSRLIVGKTAQGRAGPNALRAAGSAADPSPHVRPLSHCRLASPSPARRWWPRADRSGLARGSCPGQVNLAGVYHRCTITPNLPARSIACPADPHAEPTRAHMRWAANITPHRRQSTPVAWVTPGGEACLRPTDGGAVNRTRRPACAKPRWPDPTCMTGSHFVESAPAA